MNANEQLDFYNPDSIYYGNSRHYIQQLEAKVRQQQAEIEALKQIIDANNLNQNIGQFVKPTNEPVAWTDGKGNYFDKNSFFPVDDLIPLYTHPVKELTDFEIKGVMALDECWIGEDCSMPNMIEFARAILRKAQE